MIRSILRPGASACHKYAGSGSGSSQTLTGFTHRRLSSSSSTGPNNAGSSSSSSRNSKGEIANNNTTESKRTTTGVTLSQESLSQIGSVVADSFSTSFLRLITYGVIGALGGTLVLNYKKKHRDKSDNLRMPSPPRSSYAYMMTLVETDEYRLGRLRKKKGLGYPWYPYVWVAYKDQKIITSFTIPAICNIPDLIRFIVSNLGLKLEDLRGSNIERSYRKVDWRLTNERKQVQGEEEDTEEDLTVLISHYGNESEIKFIKGGSLTDKELLVLVNVLKLAGESTGGNATSKKPNTPVLQ